MPFVFNPNSVKFVPVVFFRSLVCLCDPPHLILCACGLDLISRFAICFAHHNSVSKQGLGPRRTDLIGIPWEQQLINTRPSLVGGNPASSLGLRRIRASSEPAFCETFLWRGGRGQTLPVRLQNKQQNHQKWSREILRKRETKHNKGQIFHSTEKIKTNQRSPSD